MDYDQFITEIQNYWDMRKKGLKKQANSFLFAFTKQFQENVPETEADAILFRFCREYIDEIKFPGEHLPQRHLPFQITKLLDGYLDRECKKNKMPQMRWAYEIFGNRYNPHDPKLEHDFYPILERAYMHKECDPQTVRLYVRKQLDLLWWGQHHFPESCLITKAEFERVVGVVNEILSEKNVEPQFVESFEYYVKLYHIYFRWQENDRNGNFYELCKREGIEFEGIPAIYYKKSSVLWKR